MNFISIIHICRLFSLNWFNNLILWKDSIFISFNFTLNWKCNSSIIRWYMPSNAKCIYVKFHLLLVASTFKLIHKIKSFTEISNRNGYILFSLQKTTDNKTHWTHGICQSPQYTKHHKVWIQFEHKQINNKKRKFRC